MLSVSVSLSLPLFPDYIILSDYSLSQDAQTYWRLQCNITCLYDLRLLHEICHHAHHTTGNIRPVCLPLRRDSFIVINHTQEPRHRRPGISMLQPNLCNYAINQSNLRPSSDHFICRHRFNVHKEVVLPCYLCAPQNGTRSWSGHARHSVRHSMMPPAHAFPYFLQLKDSFPSFGS